MASARLYRSYIEIQQVQSRGTIGLTMLDLPCWTDFGRNFATGGNACGLLQV
jgi:hypothetical protein